MGISSMKSIEHLNKLFLEFFNMKTLWQMAKYLVTGLVSFASYILIIYILTDFLGIWKYLSITISYVTVFWLNFLLSKFWTFKEKQRNSTKKQLIFYTCLFFANLIVTYIIVHILTDIFGVHYIIPPIICNFLSMGWNFILYKKVIYK
jgi:putative flippase GtrA